MRKTWKNNQIYLVLVTSSTFVNCHLCCLSRDYIYRNFTAWTFKTKSRPRDACASGQSCTLPLSKDSLRESDHLQTKLMTVAQGFKSHSEFNYKEIDRYWTCPSITMSYSIYFIYIYILCKIYTHIAMFQSQLFVAEQSLNNFASELKDLDLDSSCSNSWSGNLGAAGSPSGTSKKATFFGSRIESKICKIVSSNMVLLLL